MLRNFPIRRKILIGILSTSVIVMVLLLGMLFGHEFFAIREAMHRQLSTLGAIIANNSAAALAFENRRDAQQTLDSLSATPYMVAAAIYDSHGNVFSKYPADLSSSELPAAPGELGYDFSGPYLAGFQAMQQHGQRFGTLYLKLDAKSIMRDWLRDHGMERLLALVEAREPQI